MTLASWYLANDEALHMLRGASADQIETVKKQTQGEDETFYLTT